MHNSVFDVWMMVVFGVAGYAFKKLAYPLAPLVLAIVLGDRAEASFRQAMLVSQGDLTVFFSNALVGTMTGTAQPQRLVDGQPVAYTRRSFDGIEAPNLHFNEFLHQWRL